VLVAFDREILERAATHHGGTIELVAAVGEYVSPGQPLLRIHGDGPLDDRTLLSAVTIGSDRTLGEPAYAIRIIVDTAIRTGCPPRSRSFAHTRLPRAVPRSTCTSCA
jgi:uncharacterized membrane protein